MLLQSFREVGNVTFVLNSTARVTDLNFLGAQRAIDPSAATGTFNADTNWNRRHEYNRS